MDVARWVELVAIVAVAWVVGEAAARVHVPRLPVYLAVGAVSALVLDRAVGTADLAHPHVSTLTLAVIGLIAGSHLVWSVVAPRLRPIALQVSFMTVAVPLLVGTATVLAVDADWDVRLAAAILAGTVMLALSPPEAIAVISESRATGPFTRLVLGATVVMDVVVVSTFSAAVILADSLLGDGSDSGGLVETVGITLLLAALGGLLVGGLLTLTVHLGRDDRALMTVVVVLAGLAAVLAPLLTEWADRRWHLHVEIDSLLVAMVAGVVAANTTRHPERLVRVLETLAPWVYVVFFTLTGLGLHLDALLAAAATAAAVWALRLTGLWTASTAAMRLAHEPDVVRRVAWRAYMPQAGIALALAATIAAEFPTFGPQLSTVVIAVVVLNEATGPFFLRSALHATGEVVDEEELLD